MYLIAFYNTLRCHSSENNYLIIEKTCEANPAGENSSFIFTVCVTSVPPCYFKLDYVVLQMAVKEFFETHF